MFKASKMEDIEHTCISSYTIKHRKLAEASLLIKLYVYETGCGKITADKQREMDNDIHVTVKHRICAVKEFLQYTRWTDDTH